MKLRNLASLAVLGSSLLLGACKTDTTSYYFDGYVYDGQTGKAITDYKLELQYLDRTQHGDIDKDGRYFVGPLAPFDDYVITITANGYRAFQSANAMKLDDEQSMNDNSHDDNTHPDRSQDFDAYIYNTTAQTEASTITITTAGNGMAPSGIITLTPTGTASPNAASDVASQVWTNDDDLHGASVTKAFTGGSVQFAAGDLVYGVTYTVTISVAGFPELTTTYTAGVQGDTAFTVAAK
jgi:hypothetical protein